MELDALLQAVREMQSSLKNLESHIIASSNNQTKDQQGNTPHAPTIPPVAGTEAQLLISNGSQEAATQEEKADSQDEISNPRLEEESVSPPARRIPAPRTAFYVPDENPFGRSFKKLPGGINDLHALIRDVDNESIAEIISDRNGFPRLQQWVDWKYFKPLFKDSMVYIHAEGQFFTMRGAGRPSLLPVWPLPDTLIDGLAGPMLFPYSATPPLHRYSNAAAFGDVENANGNIWYAPSDHRLEIFHQMVDPMTPVDIFSQLAILESERGHFAVYDFDNFGSYATYSLHHDYSAADAEEAFLRIDPSLYSMGKFGSCLNIWLERDPCSSPWRRVISCGGLKDSNLSAISWFGGSPRLHDALTLHLTSRLRTTPELDHLKAPLTFHICWLRVESDLPMNNAWISHKNIVLAVDSYTAVFPESRLDHLIFPERQYHDDRQERLNYDTKYWTLLILTPKYGHYEQEPWNRDRNTGLVKGIEVSTQVATALSAINQALSWASYSWIKVLEVLERCLDFQQSNDGLFADSADFSHSRRCFWVINTVDDHENLIADTLAQWDWYRNVNNLRELARKDSEIDRWLDSIATNYFRLKDSETRLKALRERARSRRDGLFSLTSVMEARESRVLNENVRLLTYATVFYLPLAFSSSLWSINSMFGTGVVGFAVITTVMALLTYTVIFALIKSNRQFYREQQARFKTLITRWSSDTNSAIENDGFTVDEEGVLEKSEDTRNTSRRRRWWKRRAAEDV